MFVQVLVELRAKQICQTFTYKTLTDDIEVGKRVLVPFGNQQLEGFVLKVEPNYQTDYQVKKIIKVIDEEPVLNSELIKLGKYISKKTLCNLISAYQTMLPTALKAKNGTIIPKKYIKYLKKIKDLEKATNNQKNILNLFNHNELILKADAIKISVSTTNNLIKKNILEEVLKEEYRIINKIEKNYQKPTLNEEQTKVIKDIELNKFNPYLLHGITGSGKTEVYLRKIEDVISIKKEALILVPEISLTPQFVETLKLRFGNLIAVIHSGLSNGEKYDEWRKIIRKEVSIVIGARSAVFAPLTNIGIIIVDEEHSSTYKQENNPKYNAVDIALWRSKEHNCPIILGSATPTIESYTRAKLGIYKLCVMKNRINNNYPEVTTIDMKNEIKNGNRILSQLLKDKIEEKLKKNEQVILFLNRRGFTTINTCKNCGFTHKCNACDIPYTYHRQTNTMNCHYCGNKEKPIYKCPLCKSEDMKQSGMGTEKLEQIIKEYYPYAKTLRMDNDTTSKKNSHEQIINDFKAEKYNILIGTQMISKGLNFPKVTLVGILNCDASLNLPDFRSSERTFELINQVAGRSGRADLKGEVIIQGFYINHYSIIKASQNDYEGFYEEEMKIRKKLNYSPYYNLCLISIRAKNENIAYKEGNKIVSYLNNEKLNDTFILGPSFSVIPKINNIYQVQVIIKYKKSETIISKLQFLNETYRNNNKVTFDIDINPIRL